MASGIEAIIAGLKDGGAKRAYNFPGFHSHEIAEGLGSAQISLNERAAYAEAYGACLAGDRAVVTFKNVGLNIAADAFLHSLIGGVNAGLVVVVTDDTFVVGSQEFQDSRHFFDFYGGLWLEPSTPQEAYDMATSAFSLSENLDIPVVIRLSGMYFTKTDSFSRTSPDIPKNSHTYHIYPERYVVHPYYFAHQDEQLNKKRFEIQRYIDSSVSPQANRFSDGVIICGAAEYNGAASDILRITTLPLPHKVIDDFIDSHDKVTIYEDGDDFMYEKIITNRNGALLKRSQKPPRGTLTKFVKWSAYENIFRVIHASLSSAFVAGDITQFTVETTDTIGVALSLGTAVSTAIGAADALGEAYAIVGDTSFLHEGRGILEEALKRGQHIGVIIIDNDMSWCTGGQRPADNLSHIMGMYPSSTVDARDGDLEDLHTALSSMANAKGLYVVRIRVPYIEPLVRH